MPSALRVLPSSCIIRSLPSVFAPIRVDSRQNLLSPFPPLRFLCILWPIMPSAFCLHPSGRNDSLPKSVKICVDLWLKIFFHLDRICPTCRRKLPAVKMHFEHALARKTGVKGLGGPAL